MLNRESMSRFLRHFIKYRLLKLCFQISDNWLWFDFNLSNLNFCISNTNVWGKLTWVMGGNINNNSKSSPFYMFTTCIIYTNSRIFSKFKKIYYQVLFKVHRKKQFNAYTLTEEMYIEFIAFCTSEQIHNKITKIGIFSSFCYM